MLGSYLVRLSPAVVSGTGSARLPGTPELARKGIVSLGDFSQTRGSNLGDQSGTYFRRLMVRSAGASVVETQRVLSERRSLRRGVGVVRLLPCSVGNRRGERRRRKMVVGRKVVQRKMVRRKRRSLRLPLQTRDGLSRVKAVASACEPGGRKPGVKNSKPGFGGKVGGRVPVVKKYCGAVRPADGTGR